MEIIFVTASMTGGGTERVISVLSNSFVKEGYQVSILMTAGTTVAYELDKRVKVIVIGGQTGGSIRKRLERIKNLRVFFKEHPKAVICGMGIETNMFTVAASRGLQNRVIISERNDPNQCSYKILRNFFYGMSDVLVCQTEDAVECFPTRIKKRATVIPNPVDPELPEPFRGERRKEIVAAGRLSAQKNHKLLLEAFALFLRHQSEYKLIIYGQGELEEELRGDIQRLGISDSVELPGFARNLAEKIRGAAMYVLSSDYEGISNSLSEAMAVGLPVISTDCPIGGSKLCICNKKNGLLVPTGDVKKLAEAMEFLAGNPGYAGKLGREAEKIRDMFSQDSISRMWIASMKG